jgi:hypothetical protein
VEIVLRKFNAARQNVDLVMWYRRVQRSRTSTSHKIDESVFPFFRFSMPCVFGGPKKRGKKKNNNSSAKPQRDIHVHPRGSVLVRG